MPGAIVAGKFRVDAVVGQGGMGIVYRAFHLDLEQPVAIKLLREDLTRDETIVLRMLREARTAAKLRSEHVARVLDVARLPSGAPYLVMEYLEGRDLGMLLEVRGTLEPSVAVDVILQSCEAVAEAHAHGIIHRDLKPENLFMTTNAHDDIVVKVLDFGISKDLSCNSSLTQPKMVMGSPAYMSPEQMRGDDAADARADIWSLGAVLYEIVTGRPPFDGQSLPAICHRVCNEDPIAPSVRKGGLPVGLEPVILRAMSKRPEERYATVADFADALAPFVETRGPERAERVRRVLEHGDPSRRSRTGITPVDGQRASALSISPSRREAETLPSLDRATPGSVVPVVSGTAKGRRSGRARSIAAVALLAALVLLGSRAAVLGARAQGFGHAELTPELPAAVGLAQPRTSATSLGATPVTIVSPAPSEPPLEAQPRATTKPAGAPRASNQAERMKPSSASKTKAASATPRSVDAWDPSAFGGRK